MTMKKNLVLLLLGLLVFTGCSKDDDTPPVVEETPDLTREDFPVQDFMYQAMNVYYLYKADIPELADDYFTSLPNYVEYLSKNPDPENFFYDELVSDRDRFSFVTDDYVALENAFQGISKTDGIELSFAGYNSGGTVYAAGIIRYVAPDSPAAEKGLKRGQAIIEINGERLTVSEQSLSSRAIELLSLDSYTLSVSSGFSASGQLSLDTNEFNISKIQFTENPIFLAKTLDFEGKKIGYLMYNSFVSQFDDELNDTFAQFKADGITDLVLDLRYNGGGAVDSAIDLCSMITGQNDGEVIIKRQYNDELQAYLENRAPEILTNRFNSTIYTGTENEASINSLGLNRLYVIGLSDYTASASELTVVGLEPYIDVKLIGNGTVGKFEASSTFYDSEDLGRENANPDHTYAIQPLILKYVNAAGFGGASSGLVPDFQATEALNNLGTLGDPEEPLLKIALNQILGRSSVSSKSNLSGKTNYQQIKGNFDHSPAYQRMYVNDIPVIKN